MLTTYQTTLSQKKQLTKDVFLFRFQLKSPQEINFKAGQYLILKIRDKSRLYSIASPESEKDSFELLVEIVPGGLASTYLSNLKVGDEAIFQGPAGVFTLRQTRRGKIFLVTGTGIAPVRSMTESLLNPKDEIQNPDEGNLKQFRISNFEFRIFLFWGLRHFSDVYFLNELKSYKLQAANFDCKICLSREKNLEMIPKEDREYFALGHIQDGLQSVKTNLADFNRFQPIPTDSNQFKPIPTNFDYYLCGSRDVVESLRQYLEEKGVPKEQVFFEKF